MQLLYFALYCECNCTCIMCINYSSIFSYWFGTLRMIVFTCVVSNIFVIDIDVVAAATAMALSVSVSVSMSVCKIHLIPALISGSSKEKVSKKVMGIRNTAEYRNNCYLVLYVFSFAFPHTLCEDEVL